MYSPHFLGNFKSPSPLHQDTIGPPRQIAYYSCFWGPTNEYEYQSRNALGTYLPPKTPFLFPNDKESWKKECDYLNSLPPEGIEPVITSCRQAGRTEDLLEADVIAKRGALVK